MKDVTSPLSHRFVASPTLDPKAPLDQVLATAARHGFCRFEAMTDWAEAAFDVGRGAAFYQRALTAAGLSLASLHLPRVRAGDNESLRAAFKGIDLAQGLGATVVIYKADSPETYARHAQDVVAAAAAAGLTVVVTNHKNSAIETVADMAAVLDACATPALGTLLEVGHYAAAGQDWRAAAEAFAGRIGLVHIKDVMDGAPVPYGTGSVGFAAVFQHLVRMDYAGPVVVEIEKVPSERVEQDLARAVGVVTEAAAKAGFA